MSLVDSEKEIYNIVQEDGSGLVQTIKDIGKSTFKSLPFMDIDEEYDFTRLVNDIAKSIFIVGGFLEFSKADPNSFEQIYALRNLPFYMISATPSFIKNLKDLNKEFYIFSEKVHNWEPKNALGRFVKTAYQILEDEKIVLTTQIMFAFDSALRPFRLNDQVDLAIKTFESKYGIGPTVPQHLALGYGLTKLTKRISEGVSKNSKSILPYLIPPLFMGSWEIFEINNQGFFNTVPLDSVSDMIAGMMGYGSFWLQNKSNSKKITTDNY